MKNATQIYQFKKEKFGQFDLVRLFNDKNEIAIVPNYGGHLLSLKMVINGQSVNVLDSYETEKELIEQSYSKSSILLPFPNRLKDGQFQYQGKSYQFPVNDLSTQNNLHGFKAFYDMKVISVDTESEQPSVTLSSIYNGKLSEYPFPFEFLMTYTLSGYNELTCQIKIENIGNQTMPIGFGWHPYFRFSDISVDDLVLETPPCEQIEIDNRMIPTGKTTEFTTFQAAKQLENQSFDTCFKSTTAKALTEITIKSISLNTSLTFWQETEPFPYFQIFTPNHRKSIAIEPMTCNVDAFNNKEGLIELEKGQAFVGRFGIKVRKCES